METLLTDLRYGLRSLLKRPAVFAVATLSLALGIAANTTIFAAVDAYLIRPLPYPDPDRIVQVWVSNPTRGWQQVSISGPDFRDVVDAHLDVRLVGAEARRGEVEQGKDVLGREVLHLLDDRGEATVARVLRVGELLEEARKLAEEAAGVHS